MAIPFHKNVSSIEALHSSIEYDAQVCRWFQRYLSHPQLQKRLSSSLGFQKQYINLKKLEMFTGLLLCIILAIIATVLVSKQQLLLLAVIPTIGGVIKLNSLRRKQTADICRDLLLQDKESLRIESKTLFQICEIYGRNLNIPTLVDTITAQDAIMRKTFLYACVVTCFIYPFGFWDNWVNIIGSYALIQTFVNTPLVFDRLK